jgi:GrpB-like predicted nucleotidyltransferase (UPF0157 family)
LRIEHVGSTSVPELPAKPVIDILLVVAKSAKEIEYVQALESAAVPASYPRARLARAPDVQESGEGR